jgi:hypothetical protein
MQQPLSLRTGSLGEREPARIPIIFKTFKAPPPQFLLNPPCTINNEQSLTKEYNINGVQRLSVYIYNIEVYFRSALIGCY